MKCKEDIERTALTWKSKVQRLKERSKMLRNNLKSKRNRFGVAEQAFPQETH